MESIFLVLLIFQALAGTYGIYCHNETQFEDFTFFRPIAKENLSNLCYWAFSQGPCADGEWFTIQIDAIRVPNKVRIEKCEARRCPKIHVTNWEFPTYAFLYNELCMQTDDINVGFCGSNSTKVYYGEEDAKPTCSEIRPTSIDGRFLGIDFGHVYKKLTWQDPESVEARKRRNKLKKNWK